MDFHFYYTAGLLLLMVVLLVREWFSIEMTVFGILMLLVVGEVITLKEAFDGFSNEGTLSIALLFIIAGALNNAGVMNTLGTALYGDGKESVGRKLLRILPPVSALSAFMNNTPIVAVLTPATRNWATKYNLAASKYLIPISFAAIMGGMCTLIGTSTNLIIHGLMIDEGLEGMGFFEIGLIGLPLALAGIFFIVVFGHRLLPDNKEHLVELGENTREFVIELKVHRGYQGIGKTIEEAGLRHLEGLFLFQIERNNQFIAPAPPDARIQLGDRLFFTGLPKTILDLQRTPGLELTRDSHFDLKQYNSSNIKTFECTISPGSPLLGKTVRDSDFRNTYSAVIIAIHRHGERMEKKIGDIVLKAGDTLLLLAKKNFRQKWYHSKDFYLIAGGDEIPSRPRWQMYATIAVYVTMVLLAALKVLPLVSAAGLGVMTLVGLRIVSGMEMREMIDLRVLAVIGISLGIAAAARKSGVAEALAGQIVDFSSGFGAVGVLSGVYIFTSACNLLITRNAAAAVMFPIAIAAASKIGADERAFAVAVAIAAAASFATPISSPTNLMVYGAGGYTFKNFMKIGIPLQAMIGILALVMIYWFYL